MFWRLHLAGWLVYGVGTYLATITRLTPDQFLPMLGLKVVRTAIGYFLSLVLHVGLRSLRGRGVDWGRLSMVSIPITLALGAAWLALYWTITGSWRVAGLPAAQWSTFPRALLDHTFVLLMWAAADIGFHEWRAREASERRARETALELRNAELDVLRYQLNPHFLFNALNALRASMPANAETARNTVDALSGFLRHALHASPLRTVPLAREIEAATQYLAVERVRYGTRLEVHLEVDPSVEQTNVPGFLLQPLAENAVKHGMASAACPLRVTMSARRVEDAIRIEVANSNGVSPRPGSYTRLFLPCDDRPRIGLENVRERLRRHYGDRARFELVHGADAVTASIVIPAESS